MNAVLVPSLGVQRESEAQRRVDAAVRFAVWACAQPTIPNPESIMREFGVSRRTCSRWRKSLSRALMASVLLPDRRTRPKPLSASASDIAACLVGNAPILDLPVASLVRDIRATYRCCDETARKAVRQAMTQIGGHLESFPVEPAA